ncbi:MAG: RluA family pseudouridine synthase [Oscillospiraceae bacterium]|nr:RluA family pseudouridine synthase [Oscillospiraceae bacterium]
MLEYIVGARAGKPLGDYLLEQAPALGYARVQKLLRLREIRLNGRKTTFYAKLSPGDRIQVYVPALPQDAPAPPVRRGFEIVYEDDNVLLVQKEAGVLCDDVPTGDTLLNGILGYLRAAGFSGDAHLCNRIDYNTSGIVIAAKNAQSKAVLDEKIRLREIEKKYVCVVVGAMAPPDGTLENQLFKDAKQNRVYISDKGGKGSKTAVTRYRTLAGGGELSLLECELVTGRTHQIRSQLAYAGCPILGDGKYGRYDVNKRYRESAQLLCAYKLRFAFRDDGNCLSYLNGRSFCVRRVDFCEKYFPGALPKGKAKGGA